MKLEEMILVIEEGIAMEHNYLSSFQDYLETLERIYPEDTTDRADAIEELYVTRQRQEKRHWTEESRSSVEIYHARFCQGADELREFLQGKYNAGHNKELGYMFSRERCSKECMEVLQAYGIDQNGDSLPDPFIYETEEHVFQKGEKIRNFNGEDYRVLEPLSEHDLLLMNERSGEIVAAYGVEYSVRMPNASYRSTDSEFRGVDWRHGRYLGNQILNINLAEIKKEHEEKTKWNKRKAMQKKAPAATGPKL